MAKLGLLHIDEDGRRAELEKLSREELIDIILEMEERSESRAYEDLGEDR